MCTLLAFDAKPVTLRVLTLWLQPNRENYGSLAVLWLLKVVLSAGRPSAQMYGRAGRPAGIKAALQPKGLSEYKQLGPHAQKLIGFNRIMWG